MIDEIHNYTVTFDEIHSTFKKIIMTNQIKSEIFRVLKMHISFNRIIFSLRVVNSIIEISFADFTNFEIINFIFIFRNIYNMKTQLRRKFLNSLIFIQILIRKFDQKN